MFAHASASWGHKAESHAVAEERLTPSLPSASGADPCPLSRPSPISARSSAQDKRPGSLPASIQNVPLDELQRMFVDSLKKLKARDKRIADLASANEASAAEAAVLRKQLAAQRPPAEPADNGATSRLEVRSPAPDLVGPCALVQLALASAGPSKYVPAGSLVHTLVEAFLCFG